MVPFFLFPWTVQQKKYMYRFLLFLAVDNAEFCDKSQLSLDGSIDVDATICQHEGMRNHFKSCQVTCSQRYTMKSKGKVMCDNGMFLPRKPCVLVDLEVKLCVLTNMVRCVYPRSTYSALANRLSKVWIYTTCAMCNMYASWCTRRTLNLLCLCVAQCWIRDFLTGRYTLSTGQD